jgi:hypothetical protein
MYGEQAGLLGEARGPLERFFIALVAVHALPALQVHDEGSSRSA